MAVVQISKIQVRRGKKNQGTGMPQLASGEMAWAIDTQEVFIGNGAVGEGAPYVCNTKILTEHDSLLELANIYQYKKESVIPVAGTVTRSLQDRLDDGIVNVKNWGIITYPYPVTSSETIASQTVKIQQAISEISSKVRATLEFDPGEYRFLETLTLPSHVKIVGAGKHTTIFKFTGTGNAFVTASDASNIVLDEFTVKVENTNSVAILIDDADRLRFSNLRLEYGTTYQGAIDDNLYGLKIIGSDAEIKNNRFNGLEFSGLSYAVYTEGNASHNNFDDCLLEYLYDGFSFGNLSSGGANYNTVTNSIFDQIQRHAIVVHNGYGNLSRGNIFKNAGVVEDESVINFVTEGNSSEQDIFKNNESYNKLEVGGIVYRQQSAPKQISLQSTSGDTAIAFRLPIGTATAYEISYIYKSTTFNQTRKGTLHVTFDAVTNQQELVDEYEYVGLSPSGETAIKFSVGFTFTSGVKHLVIEYINNNGTGEDVNTFTYTYSVLG
jgi:flavodoxin